MQRLNSHFSSGGESYGHIMALPGTASNGSGNGSGGENGREYKESGNRWGFSDTPRTDGSGNSGRTDGYGFGCGGNSWSGEWGSDGGHGVGDGSGGGSGEGEIMHGSGGGGPVLKLPGRPVKEVEC